MGTIYTVELCERRSGEKNNQNCLSKSKNVEIRRTVMLPVAWYGCETRYLTLREAHRLRVFENAVLRKVLGPARDEVTGEWRRLRNEELNAVGTHHQTLFG
jgi:hypothetical protein